MKKDTTIDYSALPPECDELCKWRNCLHKMENKGPYAQGRGYTSYYDKPVYACGTRLVRGCPFHPDFSERIMPDLKKMIDDFKIEMEETKTSKKAKIKWRKQINAMEMVYKSYLITTKEQN